jgi:hypothetical protein
VPLADALMPYACKSTIFCAENSRFGGIMMGHEGQFGLLHRTTRIEICTKKAHASSLKHVSLNGMGRIVLY